MPRTEMYCTHTALSSQLTVDLLYSHCTYACIAMSVVQRALKGIFSSMHWNKKISEMITLFAYLKL
jgi:hypothetical protein